jgi:hypothetical protein
VFRRYWREPEFWRWWWQNRAPAGVRVGAGLLLLGLVLGGGLFAVSRLPGASGGGSPTRGHTAVVTTVRRVTVRPQDTRYVTTPRRRTQVVRFLPAVKRRVVTVALKARSVTKSVPTTKRITRTRTQTQTSQLTDVQTATSALPPTVVGAHHADRNHRRPGDGGHRANADRDRRRHGDASDHRPPDGDRGHKEQATSSDRDARPGRAGTAPGSPQNNAAAVQPQPTEPEVTPQGHQPANRP